MVVSELTVGLTLLRSFRSILTTVPSLTVFGLAATVPLRTFVTNRSAVLPLSSAVMSHGPLTSGPVIVSTGLPPLSSTSRQPACADAELPFLVGRLPTITHPL